MYPGQWRVVTDDHRIRIVAGGERGGKSFVSATDLVTRIPWGREFWLIGPDYYLPRAEFEYIEEFLWKLGAISGRLSVSKPKEGSWRLVTKSGQLIVTRTSADVRKLAARPVDGIILCEAGQQSYDTYLKAIGRVSEPRGFVLASGTFESSYDWYAQTHAEWMEDPDGAEGVAYSLPTWDNTFIFPGGRDDPEIRRLERLYASIPGYFEEKCGAKPAPPLGVVFREFSWRSHVREEVLFSDRLPVYLAIDPGHGGASAYTIAACQFVPDPVWYTPMGEQRYHAPEDPIDFCHVIDVIYAPGASFEDIFPMAQERVWWENVAGGAIDCEAPDERKRWNRFGGVVLSSKKVMVRDGERRLHSFLHWDKTNPLSKPHLLFSPEVPPRALREFFQYRSSVDSIEGLDARPSAAARSRKGPEHLLKALWYLLIARYGPVKTPKMPGTFVRPGWSKLKWSVQNALGRS